MSEPQQFFDAMLEKFDQKSRTGRSKFPWVLHPLLFLQSRLREEWEEYIVAERMGGDVEEELLDIANFAMFLWLKINGDE